MINPGRMGVFQDESSRLIPKRKVQCFGSTFSSEVLYFGAPKEIIQSADSKPAISIRFKHNAVAPVLVSATMIIRQQINQLVGFARALGPETKANLAWF